MKILIIDNHSEHLLELTNCFSNLPKIINKETFDKGFAIENFDSIILSGSFNMPTALRHPNFYKQEIDLIKNSKTPIIGICLGAELIIKSFDGKLEELSHSLDGEVKLNVSDKNLKTIIESNHIKVIEHHKIGAKNLPKDLLELASSPDCVEIFKHASKPIIGIQFHPEIGKHKEIFDWAIKELKI
ncbi:MAG: gamma-glutamyl-gamma-aminobutyrate hydrolase family protein [Candidatus Falkowbacteria bacterium]|nr:gamma-glutamyl-gamma-aminobutyrate hydrolase family protein [Candidatus Falkowbacteria bacterium]